METPRRLFLFIATVFLWTIVTMVHTGGAAIRDPVWAGKFYPKDRDALERLICRFTEAALQHRNGPPRSDGLKALIMPHAGYVYSGATAAHASLAIAHGQFDRVILLGPDHRVGFPNAAVSGASAWRTPLGTVPVSRSIEALLNHSDLFSTVAASDQQEHSLEVILPFLQSRLRGFDLVPVVLGPCDAAKIAQILDPQLQDTRTLLVVSADLSHYLPYHQAVKRDRETLNRILSLDRQWEQDQDNRTCGRYPVAVLLELARNHNWRPELLHYSNSGDTAGDRHAVVGYGAVAFYGDEIMDNQSDTSQQLTPMQGAVLVALARQTLAGYFGETITSTDTQHMETALNNQALQASCGTFVTLKINEQLRGCIGSLSATGPIVSGVRDNAINAAFHDPRFPPLSKKELDAVHIEVSVLTEPVPLSYTGANDLLSKLRVGIDGVIIKKGYASATFLPQVWEQLPQPEQFCSHLCMKAGLPAGQWREGDLEVLVYQVQYFEEAR